MKSFIKGIGTTSFLIPAGMALAGIAYLIGCSRLNFGTVSLPAEGFVPFMVGILLLVGSCWLAVDAFVMTRKLPASSPKTERTEIINVLLLVGILLGYVILLSVLGFILCTMLLLVTSAKIMGAKWGSAFSLAIGVTIICYILFIFWLKVPFPSPYFM
jgi:hypothetical protein